MINEEKVIMMTKLASYESGEGKKDISILNYFRNDYIGFQLLKSVISATISFLAIFAVYAFYNFEQAGSAGFWKEYYYTVSVCNCGLWSDLLCGVCKQIQ